MPRGCTSATACPTRVLRGGGGGSQKLPPSGFHLPLPADYRGGVGVWLAAGCSPSPRKGGGGTGGGEDRGRAAWRRLRGRVPRAMRWAEPLVPELRLLSFRVGEFK